MANQLSMARSHLPQVKFRVIVGVVTSGIIRGKLTNSTLVHLGTSQLTLWTLKSSSKIELLRCDDSTECGDICGDMLYTPSILNQLATPFHRQPDVSPDSASLVSPSPAPALPTPTVDILSRCIRTAGGHHTDGIVCWSWCFGRFRTSQNCVHIPTNGIR